MVTRTWKSSGQYQELGQVPIMNGIPVADISKSRFGLGVCANGPEVFFKFQNGPEKMQADYVAEGNDVKDIFLLV